MGTVKLKPPDKIGRYTFEAAAMEVSRAIRRGGRGTHAQLARELGISSQQLSHRLAVDYSRFSIVQLGICADFFAKQQGQAGYGRGWPLMSYEESLALWGKGS